jgi:hypothetical protein
MNAGLSIAGFRLPHTGNMSETKASRLPRQAKRNFGQQINQ